ITMSLWGRSLLGRYALLLLSLALLSGVASCSGTTLSGTAADPAGTAGQLNFDNTAVSTDLAATESGTTGLPSIPLDTDSRAASEGGGFPPPPPEPETRVILGSDFVLQWSGEVQDTAIRLDSGIEEPNPFDVAFAMYRVSDSAGRRPLEMTVEAAVGAEGQKYWLALADYTRGSWQWFGPASGDFTVDLRERHARYTSRAGNMYFMLVAHNENTVTHAQTSVLIGAGRPEDHPGCPVQLRASDGEYSDSVLCEWLAGEGAVSFEVFRSKPAAPGQPPQWASLGFTTEQSFSDATVEVGKPYIYRVRAINEAGHSAFSNHDRGWAGELEQGEHFEGEIRGRVVQGNTEQGLGNIYVGLLGAPNGEVHMNTLPNGEFGFPHLPVGNYIVFPQNPDLEFEPRFIAVRVDPEHPMPQLRFEARPGEHKRALWGFVYTMGGPENPGLHPLADIAVKVKKTNTQDPPLEVRTGEMGFWMAGELANGEYDVRPVKEGMNFIPLSRLGHIDGVHMTPALNFRGQPPPPGGGGPN
nr:DUF2012 domain-containing protein [bacterium]